MGGVDKAMIPLGGRPLLAHAIARLRPQVEAMVLSANGDPARFAQFGLPVVADPLPGFAGPLAGILAGMQWTRTNLPEAERIVTAATDTPFFPADLALRLLDAAGARSIAIARSGRREHRVFGVFPVACADALDRFIKTSDSLSVGDWLDETGHVAVDFDDEASGGIDPFFNINTPEDLVAAEALLRSEGSRQGGRPTGRP